MPYEGPTELWAALPNRQRRIRYGLRLFPGGTGESHGGIRFLVRRLAWEAGRPHLHLLRCGGLQKPPFKLRRHKSTWLTGGCMKTKSNTI